MKWTIKTIRKSFGNKLIGSLRMRDSVCKAFLFLPSELIHKLTKTVWFISTPEDAWALTFRGNELKNRHLIFLSEELLQQTDEQIRFTVLHEVGHVVLNHRNSIGYAQTQTEINKQEKEADTFAQQFVGSRYRD